MPFEFSIEATGDYADTPPMPKEPKISVAPEAGEADATKLNNITAAFGAMTFNMSNLSDACLLYTSPLRWPQAIWAN